MNAAAVSACRAVRLANATTGAPLFTSARPSVRASTPAPTIPMGSTTLSSYRRICADDFFDGRDVNGNGVGEVTRIASGQREHER